MIKKSGKTKPGKVRTRFAPSPTGYLHIGSARTALFNYLFAKQNNGVFVLRIEDTDKERSKKEFESEIIESLQWLGIKEDEGPIRQSERTAIYKKYLEKLLTEKKAYLCFCTPEELEAQKDYQMAEGLAPKYNGKCANLSDAKIQENIKAGKKSVIRLRMQEQIIKIHDIIRGEVSFDTRLIGDIVIAKDLENPLYNFSVVVDDHEMKISHVIRGEDHISNTPKQIAVQEALGFSRPIYCHLPLILGPDRSKLSKRHGAVSISEYRQEGYLPEAIINMLAFLGWNPGDEREIFSMQMLVKEFALEKIHKAGAIFNINRLDFLNSFYIKHLPAKKLAELCIPYLVNAGLVKPKIENLEYIASAVALYQERLKKLSEIGELVDFCFKDKISYQKELLFWKEMDAKSCIEIMEKLKNFLTSLKPGDWKKEKLEKLLMAETEKISPQKNGKPDRGYALWPLRAALTGKKNSAGPFEVASVLGKEKTLERLDDAINLLTK